MICVRYKHKLFLSFSLFSDPEQFTGLAAQSLADYQIPFLVLEKILCNFKIARINQVRFLVRFVAAISQGFRARLKVDAILARQKLHRVAATKIACVNGP